MRPDKTAHRNSLAPLLQGRTHKAIEFKHMNISAVLDEMGLPLVQGYRSLPHYQKALKAAVEEHLASRPALRRRLTAGA